MAGAGGGWVLHGETPIGGTTLSVWYSAITICVFIFYFDKKASRSSAMYNIFDINLFIV